jgi:hypothetical protein
VRTGDDGRKRRYADHIWDPIRDRIDVPAVWTCHQSFVYVDLRKTSRGRRERRDGLTDFEKHMVQLLQKVIVEHIRSLRGKRRISDLIIKEESGNVA